LQYNQDYDEKYAPGVNPYGEGNGWAGQIYPYVKSEQVFICPDDSSSYLHTSGSATSYGYNRNLSVYNAGGAYGVGANGTSLAAFTSPAKTILLFEVQNSGYYDVANGFTGNGDDNQVPNVWAGGSPSGCGAGDGEDINGYHAPPWDGNNDGTTVQYVTGILRNSAGNSHNNFAANPRHTNGANYVLADGHAKYLTPGSVSGGYPNLVAGNCGLSSTAEHTSIASSVDCSDNTIAATFNYM